MQIEGGWGMARALLMISFLYYTQDAGPGAFLHSAKLSGESVCTDSTTLFVCHGGWSPLLKLGCARFWAGSNKFLQS